MTFPDLREELDRMFPGWRTWNDKVPKCRERKEEPTMEDRLRDFVMEQEGEEEET